MDHVSISKFFSIPPIDKFSNNENLEEFYFDVKDYGYIDLDV